MKSVEILLLLKVDHLCNVFFPPPLSLLSLLPFFSPFKHYIFPDHFTIRYHLLFFYPSNTSIRLELFSTLAWKIPWTEEPGRLQSMGSRRVGHDWATHFHFHALEKEMATHSSVLGWRIPGMGEPGGLLSMGLHRVGYNWSDLAAAAAARLLAISSGLSVSSLERLW